MKVRLSADEARVIGALMEKQVTTPDQYPLSLNALTNACNQKSNRDPVVTWAEADVQRLLDGLARRALAVDRSGFGSRVPKYRHLFCNTEFGSLKFTPQEFAVVCELLLRGPQTPGELRSRASRMATLDGGVGEVEQVLQALAEREDGPFVTRLAREPGRRESRYAQLFTAGDKAAGPVLEAPPQAASRPAPSPPADRLDRLEQAIEALQMEVAELKRRLGEEDVSSES